MGLPHCRQILYRLSHQGSPVMSPGCLVNGPGVIFSPGSDVILALSLVACRPASPWGVWGAQASFVPVWLTLQAGLEQVLSSGPGSIHNKLCGPRILTGPLWACAVSFIKQGHSKVSLQICQKNCRSFLQTLHFHFIKVSQATLSNRKYNEATYAS